MDEAKAGVQKARNKGSRRRAVGRILRFITHLEGSACLLHVCEGEKAVAGLPLLIRKLAVCHGEELLVQVCCLFVVVKLVVRSCCKEQRRRRLWQHFITNCDRLQGGCGVVVLGGGKGEVASG